MNNAKLLLKILSQHVLAICFMVATMIVSLRATSLYFIPPLDSPTPAIAYFSDTTGDVNLRNSFDTVWRSAQFMVPLYSGDFVRTEKGATAKISLSEFAKDKSESDSLEILEESFVRISVDRGTFKIKLMRGDIVTNNFSDRTIYIQKGEELTVAKKSKKKEKLEKPPTKEPEKESKMASEPKDAATPGPSTTGTDESPIEAVKADEQLNRTIGYKTAPPNGNMLLFMREESTLFRFATNCVDRCSLIIWHENSKITDVKFREAENVAKALADKTTVEVNF